jgi:hypothetical protein
MNPDQVVGTIRQFLPFVGGIATALGLTWFDGLASAVLATIGPVMTLVSLIWSLISKTHANTLTSAAAIPGVAGIVLTDTNAGRTLAANTPANVAVKPN